MSTDFFDALEAQLRTAHGKRARRRRAPRVPIRPLAAALAAIAVAVVLVTTLGGESAERSAAPPHRGVPQIDPGTGTAFRLVPHVAGVSGSGELGTEKRSLVLRIDTRGLDPAGTYWLWLLAPGRPVYPQGRTVPAGPDGRMGFITRLLPEARGYRTLLITKESDPTPARPGERVLSGALPLRRVPPPGSVRAIHFELTGSLHGQGFLSAPPSRTVATVKADRVPPTTAHRFYAAWLVAEDGHRRFVAYAGLVGDDGRMNDIFELPADARRYQRLLITRESGRGHVELQRIRGLPGGKSRILILNRSGPRVPGPVVMSGPLPFEKLPG